MSEQTVRPSEIKVTSPEERSAALIRARFNRDITRALLDGAIEILIDAGLPEENLFSYEVPGAFELPQAANRIDRYVEVDGIIALGAVVRGETPHFEYICSAATSGLQDVALEKDVPVIFGVLTCDTHEQARERAGLTEEGTNKGKESARAFLQMINHQQQLSSTNRDSATP